MDADAIADLDQATDKTTQPIRVLHVEDDPTIAGLIQEISEQERWEVEHCIDGTTALKALASDTDYDVLLVDYELPGVKWVGIGTASSQHGPPSGSSNHNDVRDIKRS